MPQRISFNLKSLIFLLLFVGPWKRCDSQVNREEADKPPDGHGGDDGAFFALRSCHQLLQGDAGEFFSPDYLCSNPPLWCNWTIQVEPGKRIHLHLEDLTPDDACRLKQDQVHVDEPAGHSGGHRVLQKCWREAEYASSSNTLYVVLLIGGWPSPPYRGFSGRYRAFGPPVIYNPQQGFTETNGKSEPALGPVDGDSGQLMDGEDVESDLQQRPANSDLMYDYYDGASSMTAELNWEDTDPEVDDFLHPASENFSHVHPFTAAPTVPASTPGTSRSGRGAAHTPSGPSDRPASPQQGRVGQDHELRPTTSSPPAVRRNVEESSGPRSEEEESADGENRTEVSQASDPPPPPSEEPEPEETHPHPQMVEQLSDHRGNLDIRNHSEAPHLPGDQLFEVAVEVSLSEDVDESWDGLARSLLLSLKALISEQLELLHTPLSMSSKRIKRLNAGVLYILWLQTGRGSGGPQVHRAVHSALQGLIATDVSARGRHGEAVITSVSTADVNECGTQLVLCDVNADCVNRFGSYSCRCRPGFQDESRLGSGGTVCVDVTAAGCSSGLSPKTKGVYVLFFLLSSLVLMLLVAAGLLYHRRRRGAFLVRCHSSGDVSPPDPNNNRRHHDDGPAEPELPPPPPPARGWPPAKERCPAVDLPLLHFSPLLPPDDYMEPQEGGKK